MQKITDNWVCLACKLVREAVMDPEIEICKLPCKGCAKQTEHVRLNSKQKIRNNNAASTL